MRRCLEVIIAKGGCEFSRSPVFWLPNLRTSTSAESLLRGEAHRTSAAVLCGRWDSPPVPMTCRPPPRSGTAPDNIVLWSQDSPCPISSGTRARYNLDVIRSEFAHTRRLVRIAIGPELREPSPSLCLVEGRKRKSVANSVVSAAHQCGRASQVASAAFEDTIRDLPSREI